MRRLFLFWILFSSITASAHILTVKDALSRQPLPLVSIYSQDSTLSAVTDARGRADISVFKGQRIIHIELVGYQSVKTPFAGLESMNYVIYLEETPILMNEVVIAAARWRQLKREIPHRSVSIRPFQVHFQNPKTAADLLGSSGEVYIQKSQLGGGSPIIRGFATNRVLIAVDGVRMNTAIFRSGNLQNVIALDPLAMEKTEVVFGPGSLMYGSDAIGGVMAFYTQIPLFSDDDRPLIKGQAMLRTGSAEFEKTGHADLSVGLKKWAFLTSVTYTDFNDLIMGRRGPDDYLRPEYVKRINNQDSVVANENPRKQVDSGYSQLNLMQKIRFQPHDVWDLEYAFHYSESSDVPRYDRLIETRNGRLRSAEWYYGPQKWTMHALNIHQSESGPFHDNARLILAAQFFEESRHDRSFGRPNLRHRVETVDAFSANLDLEKALSPSHHLFYGAEWIHNRVGSSGEQENILTGERYPVSTRYPDGAVWNSSAAYANYRFTPTARWILQAGLRYSAVTMDAEFDTTFFPFPFSKANLRTGALTGSGGLVFYPDRTWELGVNLSTGFRAPNVDDMGKVFDSEPGSVIVPNPDLKPEYAVNLELSLAKTFGEFAKIDAAAYITWLENAMVRRDGSFNGLDSILYDGTLSRVLSIQNAAKARVRGIQAGIEFKLPGNFSLLSRLNIQKGEEELDDGSTAPLRHAGPWFGSTHLIYKKGRWRGSLYAEYNGEISYENLAPEERNKPHLYAADRCGNPYSPGWWTLNFKCTVRVYERLVVNAGMENILDKRYRTYSSGIAAPGRNVIVSLQTSL
ncbi:MAG TPA: TonB-dependent receptor [bacterium]|nr:TonB-dependent receptor [bacterium]